jgi:hypothetical protein
MSENMEYGTLGVAIGSNALPKYHKLFNNDSFIENEKALIIINYL